MMGILGILSWLKDVVITRRIVRLRWLFLPTVEFYLSITNIIKIFYWFEWMQGLKALEHYVMIQPFVPLLLQ